jgi:hypothetical protein
LVHQQVFGTLGMPPNRSTSLNLQLQNKNNCSPLDFIFSFYIHGSWTLGKSYGIKPRCYWEHIGEHTCEQFGNLMGTREKIPCSPPLLKKKKAEPFMSSCWAFPLAAWNFSFQICLLPFFAKFWGLWGKLVVRVFQKEEEKDYFWLARYYNGPGGGGLYIISQLILSKRPALIFLL